MKIKWNNIFLAILVVSGLIAFFKTKDSIDNATEGIRFAFAGLHLQQESIAILSLAMICITLVAIVKLLTHR